MQRSNRRRSSIRGLLLCVAMYAGIAWFMRHSLQVREVAREAARKASCTGCFKQVALALHNYNSTWGVLPPAVTTDAAGHPMHSWRVLILPFMEEQTLYQSYNFDQPWNGPDNRKLADKMPSAYGCLSRRSYDASHTNIVAVTGPGTMFDGSRPRSIESLKPDEAQCTVWCVEATRANIPWMEPRDLDVPGMSFRINDPKRPSISSLHPAGPTIGMVDGSVWTLRPGTKPAALKSILQINATGLPDQNIGAY